PARPPGRAQRGGGAVRLLRAHRRRARVRAAFRGGARRHRQHRPGGRRGRAQRSGRTHRAARPGAVPVDLQALQAASAGKRRNQSLPRPGAEAMSDPQAGAGPSAPPAPAMPVPDRWQELPSRARTLFVATTAFGFAVPFAIATVVSEFSGISSARGLPLPGWLLPACVAAAAAFGAWLGWRRHRHTRWLLDDDGFGLRRGRLWQSDTRVPG